jgi:selenocysteine lyase/cysteine desulfurase
MTISRRALLQGIGTISIAAHASSKDIDGSPKENPPPPTILLPDRTNFDVEGTHLNAAYTHPLGKSARAAVDEYLHSRMVDGERNWPRQNPRDDSVAAYANLINAASAEIAIVPSTQEGENLIAAALGLGPGAGVVTDSLHYDASLAMYGELHKRGMPLKVIAPRDNRIDYSELEAAISPDTRLVAVSMVSSDTGYTCNLKKVCEIAHAKGALVYADVIQAAGAIPFDVRAIGIDFCCAGTYKYLMGDFGVAFLYVRADRLSMLRRVQVGWRQMSSYTRHYLPSDPPGPAGGDWEFGTDTASRFEVSTPSWYALATVLASLNYIRSIGVENIARHRAPLLARLQEELPRRGFGRLTPLDAQGSYVVFSYDGARERFADELHKDKVFVTVRKSQVRIAPSVYNDDKDIDRLLRILCA